ncbi:ribonuclease P protein subunit [Candidatus Hodarchaeum mangrovi]
MNNSFPLNTEKNLLKIRLIGLNCTIIYSGKEFTGQIIDETRNTLKILSNNGVKIIPKENSSLIIMINEQKYKIDGKYLKGRHEDRIKHRMKRKW